jgi:hypothetical protein
MSARTHTIDSVVLRLAKERNEARDLCKQLFWCLPTEGGAVDHNAINEAYYAFLRASRQWKGGEE